LLIKRESCKRAAAPSSFYNGTSFFYSAFISSPIDPSRFFMEFVSIFSKTDGEPVHSWGHSMRLDANNPISLGALDNALRNAQEPSLELLSKIIAGACTRVPAFAQAETLARVIRLAEIGAWTEATFALIALELPLWTVRRLVYENGEWLCSLSRQPNLPMAFDDCAEASHEVLPLGMLCAFVEACRRRHRARESVSAVPQVAQPSVHHIICCENYR
jgi:hypothetical protein